MKRLVMAAGLVVSSVACAALEPFAPVDGAKVALVPAAQKKVMQVPTLAGRIELFKSDAALRDDKSWRMSEPLVLTVRATAGEKGPWKVEIGKAPDLSDARNWYVGTAAIDKVSGREVSEAGTLTVARIAVPRANLEIGARYYWRVSCRGRCGWDCWKGHGCKACEKLAVSPIAAFTTEDLAPRWIAIEGNVHNIRDFGGRRGLDGRRVRQGMAYRGQGLNDNSVTGDEQGRNRLTVEDVRYLTGTLGIKTDLDLRSPGETADLSVSPLGERVTLVVRSSQCYRGIFEKVGMKAMAENFRHFCDRRNYPVYFHCIGGADRTGALAYVLNAVLGVDRRENETDWESTFYPNIPDANPDPDYWCRESHFNDGFAKYGDVGTPWNDRVVLYLKDCGVTDAEIEKFRNIMLEDK